MPYRFSYFLFLALAFIVMATAIWGQASSDHLKPYEMITVKKGRISAQYKIMNPGLHKLSDPLFTSYNKLSPEQKALFLNRRSEFLATLAKGLTSRHVGWIFLKLQNIIKSVAPGVYESMSSENASVGDPDPASGKLLEQGIVIESDEFEKPGNSENNKSKIFNEDKRAAIEHVLQKLDSVFWSDADNISREDEQGLLFLAQIRSGAAAYIGGVAVAGLGIELSVARDTGNMRIRLIAHSEHLKQKKWNAVAPHISPSLNIMAYRAQNHDSLTDWWKRNQILSEDWGHNPRVRKGEMTNFSMVTLSSGDRSGILLGLGTNALADYFYLMAGKQLSGYLKILNQIASPIKIGAGKALLAALALEVLGKLNFSKTYYNDYVLASWEIDGTCKKLLEDVKD